MILDFIWDSKNPKKSYDKLIKDMSNLAIKLVDFCAEDIALKAAWPICWQQREQKELQWFYHNLPISDPRIWECNLDPKDVIKMMDMESLSLAPSILKAWAEVHFTPVESDNIAILDHKLWGNSLIKRQNIPVFDRQLVLK